MKQLIIPWLATFLFGCGVFAIGKVIQSAEKRGRELKKTEIERRAILDKELEQVKRHEQKAGAGIMTAILGQGQQQQDERRYN